MRPIDADKYRGILVEWLDSCYHEMLAGHDGYNEASHAIADCIAELDNQSTVESIKHGCWEWFCNEPLDMNGHMHYSWISYALTLSLSSISLNKSSFDISLYSSGVTI